MTSSPMSPRWSRGYDWPVRLTSAAKLAAYPLPWELLAALARARFGLRNMSKCGYAVEGDSVVAWPLP